MQRSAGRIALVADDDEAIRLLIATTLELEGWIVRTAGDGREAIDAMLDEAPDLVVLDMMMPRVAGFEVLQAMADHPVLSDVPRIVCSARDFESERELAGMLGVHAWLVKPIEPTELLAAVDALVAP